MIKCRYDFIYATPDIAVHSTSDEKLVRAVSDHAMVVADLSTTIKHEMV